MKKELEYFFIDNDYGWNQDKFPRFMMRLGGCACVTACDSMIYLKKYKGYDKLYEKNTDNITKDDYLKFSKKMEKYLYPRWTGVDKISTYTQAIKQYLGDIGQNDTLKVKGVEGDEDISIAKMKLKSQIDSKIPLPFLMLLNKHKELKFYEWHWFMLTGYEENYNALMVKAVTYGKYNWISFDKLWDNGQDKKGGFIVFE